MRPATSKRDRRGMMTREITFQKVLLAVYLLSDGEGVYCQATNVRIAAECGHGQVAVRRSICEMRDRGIIETFDNRDGLSRRIIVLMDHDRAPLLVDHIRKSYGNRVRRIAVDA